MTTPRTPDDLYSWVISKCKEFSASPEAKAFARSGSTLVKKFYDEIFPLAAFVSQDYGGRSDVFVQPSLENDNFDATIQFLGPEKQVLYVETTYAKDEYRLPSTLGP